MSKKFEGTPLSMALAYFELKKQANNPEINDCSRKFLDYLSKFNKASNYQYVQSLQQAIYNIVGQDNPALQKILVQIWNLDLRSKQQIIDYFNKIEQKMDSAKIEQFAKAIEGYNK